MNTMQLSLGQLVRSFFEDYLTVQKGLRPGTVRSYRDALRLFLVFVAGHLRRPITKLCTSDLTAECASAFLKHLEQGRGNHIRTRNQRLAALRAFFVYIASRSPEALEAATRVAALPVKRVAPPETNYLERDELAAILRRLPRNGRRHALRDRTLVLFLYNTGARVQEVADLQVENLELADPPRVRLHGKGDKWRACPLWAQTVEHLRELLARGVAPPASDDPVFCSRPGVPLGRFGIYKLVRRHCCEWDTSGARSRRVTPHLFRHTAAVHLLESGVEVNVIRGWLGHVSLKTTNRYAELTLSAKEAALRRCEPELDSSGGAPRQLGWKQDRDLLAWLNSL
jgi:site-specific recombinase XerD